MAKKGKRKAPKNGRRKRRQPHGSAWHWKQTDCWYYTEPSTKKRVPLVDDNGNRIRGKDNKEAAQVALARVKLSRAMEMGQAPEAEGPGLVAKACSVYLQHCEKALASGTGSRSHRNSASTYLNDFCEYCGALPISELKKGHLKTWIERHPSWRSPATHRHVISVVMAAFNYAETMYGVVNPIKGYKKPKAKPRLQFFSPVDEKTIYANTDEVFGNFVSAAIYTGLRPFSELARLTADDVLETERGMMWRVYATKTKRTRKIPVFPEVAKLTRKLMKTAPKGSNVPLFRNSQGNPWKRVTGVARFLSLKKKLGWDQDPKKKGFSCYTCRHTFARRMLSGFWNGGEGCSIETLAELIGDTPKVAFDHYGREWGQHYQEPLWAAVGGGQKTEIEEPHIVR
ncbi:tyrosine-type recombinase/integrase [Planctomycetota bacterium]